MRIVSLVAAMALIGCVSARDPVEIYFANTVLVTQRFGEVTSAGEQRLRGHRRARLIG